MLVYLHFSVNILTIWVIFTQYLHIWNDGEMLQTLEKEKEV